MGYTSKKAAPYVQPDLKDGDYSVERLQSRNTAQQDEANRAAMATWSKQNSLTPSEIKTLDGSLRVEPKGERNAIGAPKSLVSKQPRGYKSGEFTPYGDKE